MSTVIGAKVPINRYFQYLVFINLYQQYIILLCKPFGFSLPMAHIKFKTIFALLPKNIALLRDIQIIMVIKMLGKFPLLKSMSRLLNRASL